jgi:hypothetical protein
LDGSDRGAVEDSNLTRFAAVAALSMPMMITPAMKAQFGVGGKMGKIRKEKFGKNIDANDNKSVEALEPFGGGGVGQLRKKMFGADNNRGKQRKKKLGQDFDYADNGSDQDDGGSFSSAAGSDGGGCVCLDIDREGPHDDRCLIVHSDL